MRALAAFTVIMLAVVGCGGDDDAPAETATSEGGSPAATDGAGSEATPTRTPIPTPTPVPEDAIAVQIVGGGNALTPTVREFRDFETAEIALPSGEMVSGVTLGSLVEMLGVDAAFVTLEGYSAGFRSIGYTRYAIGDVGSDTVFVITDVGHVTIASGSIPEAELMEVVLSVAFE